MCEYCRMTITDSRYAGEIITERKVHKFDDIGCMLAYAQEHNLNTTDASLWVMDFDTLGWVEAEKANFVLSPAIRTPMAYGIIALKEPEKARDMAVEKEGKVLQLQSLFKMDWKMEHEH